MHFLLQGKIKLNKLRFDIELFFNPYKNGGGGLNWPCDPCVHNNNTALTTQISLIYTALVMKKDLKFQFNIKQIQRLTNKEVKQRRYYYLLFIFVLTQYY